MLHLWWGGEHSAAYRGCPTYVERQEIIIQIKVEKKISSSEAVNIHREPVSKEGVCDGDHAKCWHKEKLAEGRSFAKFGVRECGGSR